MVLLQLLPALLALTVADVPDPRPAGGWVSDQAEILPPAAEARLDHRLGALERELGVEVGVVTVRGIEGTPREFATDLFRRWGLGKAGADNGLLVVLVADQRRLELETGYGLEAILPDGWLGAMQNEEMVPAFRAGDFAAGLEAGLARIDERLRSRADEARAGSRGSGALGLARDRPARSVPWLPIGVGVGGIAGAIALARWRRKRERTCPTCQIEMRLLDEVEDDQHLDPGQRKEEALASVDYRVYICGQCQASRTVAKRRWFSGYARCPRCKYRTLRSQSETLVHATYHHGGQVRVTETCQHCDHGRSYIRHTARLQRSSSSGGSWSSGSGGSSSSGSRSGGSWGGGRSGGGGAGSSW